RIDQRHVLRPIRNHNARAVSGMENLVERLRPKRLAAATRRRKPFDHELIMLQNPRRRKWVPIRQPRTGYAPTSTPVAFACITSSA
ncbi:MAG TPA: hypothetical protein PKA21_16960, partial [Kiritimatiellia bacterium]|nr:hypothetical protein [Kiritimatiellia bacterium]